MSRALYPVGPLAFGGEVPPARAAMWFSAAAMLCVAGCGTAPGPIPSAPEALTTSSMIQGSFVTSANIRRVRADMPPGYEVADLASPAAPVALWGFGADWVADPAPCAALADPAGTAPAQGISASGPGGILYAVVAGAAGAAVDLDPAVLAGCTQWSMTSPRTTGMVTLANTPQIDNAQAIGLTSSADTVVEGGTSTASTSHTYIAYLGGGYVAYVALVVDPGSAEPPLDPEVAATLLVKTVSALRN